MTPEQVLGMVADRLVTENQALRKELDELHGRYERLAMFAQRNAGFSQPPRRV